MAVCKWYLLNIRCFLSCVQIFEHFLNTLRPHFCVALCHLAVGAKIALKRGKKNCKPLFRDLHFLCELFRSRIIKFYVIWLKNVVFRLFAHSFRPRPPFNPIFSFSLKTHTGEFEEKAIFLECISNLALRLGRPTDTLEDPPNKNRRPKSGGRPINILYAISTDLHAR